jgi:hypothetical protein
MPSGPVSVQRALDAVSPSVRDAAIEHRGASARSESAMHSSGGWR